jgi:adenine-specific DNA methylase
MTDPTSRLIDRWFPVAAVDEACGTPAGSGLTEKAVFPWFASRPIAQARAAALTALLPDEPSLREVIDKAVRTGDPTAFNLLAERVIRDFGGTRPVVLDMFSGRAIIPLEAARSGAKAVGIDLSPVATLAGRLLADYPARDWSAEPQLPFKSESEGNTFGIDNADDQRPRLLEDVEIVLAEVGRRLSAELERYYPRNANGEFPWGYLWAVTMPCDHCKRRFPLIGSLVLRFPYERRRDHGQSMLLTTHADEWTITVISGPPTHEPTYTQSIKADGKKKKGKTARCPFCHQTHPIEAVKAKSQAREFADSLIVVCDISPTGERVFREPTDNEKAVSTPAGWDHELAGAFLALVPDERIPEGNVHTVMGSGYGCLTFGDLMNDRQALAFGATCHAIREIHGELLAAGISPAYARALSSFISAAMVRRLRRATRGCSIQSKGKLDGSISNTIFISDLFVNQCNLNYQFDYFETGLGSGASTWSSISSSTVQAIRKVLDGQEHPPVRLRMASATALPTRDASVDVVITDPPYYDMVEYADGSDFFHVWLKRALSEIEPDLFGPDSQQPDGLQDKNHEIIVRRVHEPNRVRHDTEFYEAMLARSFSEARRVLRPDGHLVVVFGHSDPDAWRRLLGALQTAGFVVTSAWPSRTESGATGVASIKVTVTIGCRVAPGRRTLGVAAQVDREVVDAVADRVPQWDADGLALEDQLMASYGPAMEVFGRYSRVLNPDGTDADLDRYLNTARRTVRDAMRLRVDELPLETFDAVTRFAVFWLRAKGTAEVPKGEARFFAQSDELRLDDLRGHILAESTGGFRLRLDDPGQIGPSSSVFEVVRAMASAWDAGGAEAVAAAVAMAEREPGDQHLWAVVADLARQMPSANRLAKALAGIKRVSNTVSTIVGSLRNNAATQLSLFDEGGGVH